MVLLGPVVFKLVQESQLKKGDALVVAQLAGIQAAKLTSQLISLCHHVALSHVQVRLELDSTRHAVVIQASCRAWGPTRVEMEALTSAAMAALTLYDMRKAVSRDIVLGEIKLNSKTGGSAGGLPVDLELLPCAPLAQRGREMGCSFSRGKDIKFLEPRHHYLSASRNLRSVHPFPAG
ncbi:molybdenum cofactor biosynthesis protein 1-like [Phacochoerus africanus]|uniref:molybdenum cofactor biosynthesis protein 1-like n=1 Tax=Phacochoerus africanus TaxID=41426 RepID=UPI001FD980F7|nr:molybdenum cofactor biosynthesis protein 1-like [Phacochoerus africanus]